MTLGTPTSTATHSFGNSRAFQNTSDAWERSSEFFGLSLGDSKADRPKGGKPDWYGIISHKDKRLTRHGGSRIYVSPNEVPILGIWH